VIWRPGPLWRAQTIARSAGRRSHARARAARRKKRAVLGPPRAPRAPPPPPPPPPPPAGMATAEYLHRYIEARRRYGELPERLRLAVSEAEWARSVLQYCVARGEPYAGSAAAAARACGEREYYEALLAHHRARRRLYPHHLAPFAARVLRATPFSYYVDVLAAAVRDDLPYDAIPNLAAADAVRVVGVGRNEYIALVQAAKSRRLAWRLGREALARELLPRAPRAPAPEPWWRAHLVDLGEVEARSLSPAEAVAARAAAAPAGAPAGELGAGAVAALHARGLLWFEVPVAPGDALAVPPLEGFVSNRTTAAGAADADPLEALMYQVFVAASERVSVGELAAVLGVELRALLVAASVACRLGFCRKLAAGEGGGAAGGGDALGAALGAAPLLPGAAPPAPLDLDAALGGVPASPTAAAAAPATPGAAAAEPALADAPGAGAGVALVVDAEVTGFLMMGALTPAVKKHSVTLFEGGRIAGAAAVAELADELGASVAAAAAAGLEGEMAALVSTADALGAALRCVRAAAGGRPIELLRKEPVAAMPPAAAFRALARSYAVVLPVAGLPPPPLPLPPARAGCPTHYGPPSADAASPWAQLALCAATRAGPPALALPQGAALAALPAALRGAAGALLWPWDAGAARAPRGAGAAVAAPALLAALRQLLPRSAVLVHPLGALGADGAAPTLDVPLPLAPGAEVARGYAEDGGEAVAALPPGLPAALEALGLRGAVGALRLLRADALPGAGPGAASRWVPLQLSLGLPLQPPALCRAACAAAAAAEFLSPTACAEHARGQAVFAAALAALAAEHGARAPPPAGGPEAAELTPPPAFPARALAADAAGRLAPAALGDALQGGVSLVA
jgi:hypothetical protein